MSEIDRYTYKSGDRFLKRLEREQDATARLAALREQEDCSMVVKAAAKIELSYLKLRTTLAAHSLSLAYAQEGIDLISPMVVEQREYRNDLHRRMAEIAVEKYMEPNEE